MLCCTPGRLARAFAGYLGGRPSGRRRTLWVAKATQQHAAQMRHLVGLIYERQTPGLRLVSGTIEGPHCVHATLLSINVTSKASDQMPQQPVSIHVALDLRIVARVAMLSLVAISRGCHILIEQPRASLMPKFPIFLRMALKLRKHYGIVWRHTNLSGPHPTPEIALLRVGWRPGGTLCPNPRPSSGLRPRPRVLRNIVGVR